MLSGNRFYAPHRCIGFDTDGNRRYRCRVSDLSVRVVVLRQMATTRVGVGEVARKSGIHRNVLARWLDGAGTIRLDQFLRVAVVLRIKVRVGD